ncbi:integral membrane sensor signal transduction histidine kinase [Chthoniobacter flavus Ellin428]|uniref:histidine kinase n=1 Tax=Chthoniobacter flavus Ellin428 TaxID=497964 RepID=B4D7H5_9BACT|nr:ATP-binding protein [Chthoniobacter flavus]EDY17592.1 integral membrane sensor signal transduction histidine kinase [Chthoniobacter flavus Ellin428]TCO92378.1 two-component system sensor histidine kinase QseC [Chthoniobacter flavus]
MRSIRRQITRSLLFGFIILMGLTGSAVYLSARYWLTAEFDHTLSATARSFAMLTRFDDNKVKIDFENELMPEFDRANGSAFFQLRVAGGKTIRRSRSLHESELPERFGETDRPSFWNLTLPSGRAGRAIGIHFVPKPAEEDDENVTPVGIPAVTIVVARDRTDLDRSLRWLGALLAGVGCIALGGVLFIVHRAVTRGLIPLADLGERSSQIGSHTLHTRFPVESMPSELAPICARLNDLLARLDRAFERERRFGADVAHELRTPLAELRSLAEVAQRWPDPNSETAGFFRDTLDIARQMESLVLALLAIARCEEGRQPIRRTAVEMPSLIREIWGRFAPMARDKDLKIAIEVERGGILRTDPELLRIALANLFSNAVEHAPAGGTVSIAMDVDEKGVRLTIANTVSDLQPEDVSHLFDRFWRKDSARTDGNHAGLGLSITRELTTLIGVELSAKMPSPEWVEFSLQFPGAALAGQPVEQ